LTFIAAKCADSSSRSGPSSTLRPKVLTAPRSVTERVGAGIPVRRSCGDFVLVDESAEAVSAVYVRRVAGWSWDGALRDRWTLIERSVRAMVVVMLNVCLQDAFEVTSVDDQETVEAFAAKGADETLGDRVRLRRSNRRAQDLDVLIAILDGLPLDLEQGFAEFTQGNSEL
jgi:hypothetical protein